MRPHRNSVPARSIFAVALVIAILVQSPVSFACGPFTLNAVFTFQAHPEYPLEKFAQGELGIIQPSYARSYLYVAYRYFNGGTFNPTEQQALVDLWKDRLDFRWTPGDQNWVKGWQEARQKAMAGPAPEIDVYRKRDKPNQYESYLNCHQDAFETASATVEERIRKLGTENPALKQWVEAQDQVFANCSEGQHIPVALPEVADALLRADRDYQIAAANFYAGNFDIARTQFESIALDSKSPWRARAPYMVARTLLRKASLGPEETKKAALAEAEERLNRIIKSPDLGSLHAAARRLQNLVRLRLHPEDRLHELGLALAGKTAVGNLKQDLWDYTTLLDQFVVDSETHHQETASSVNLQSDDLTDWITTLQSDKAEALDHSVERWQATSSVPWLIAALSKVTPEHAKAIMLHAAAARVPPSSPAFATASFYGVSLDISAGRILEARAKLDDLLRKNPTRFNRSSLNLLYQRRMTVATNLDDFLIYAQRLPAGFAWDESNREIPVDEAEMGEELKSLQGKTLFDSDASEVLNKMPLALLSQVAGNNRLPEHLRRDVAQAVWLRAVLLGDARTASELVPKLKTLVPDMAPLLNEYLSARDPAAKKFLAIYTWLKFPGLEPVIDTGVSRGPLAVQDSYRDNWWCRAAFSDASNTTEENKGAPEGVLAGERVPAFLTPAQRAASEREYATLAAFGAAPNYLSREVIAWATKSPADPRVPEALHLAVKTSRYGCTDKQTGKWSKAAHDLLHRRYPNNEWTKQTPYWFKD